MPPLLVAAILGVAAAVAVSKIAGRSGLVRHIWHPWLAFVGLAVLFTALIGLVLIPAA